MEKPKSREGRRKTRNQRKLLCYIDRRTACASSLISRWGTVFSFSLTHTYTYTYTLFRSVSWIPMAKSLLLSGSFLGRDPAAPFLRDRARPRLSLTCALFALFFSLTRAIYPRARPLLEVQPSLFSHSLFRGFPLCTEGISEETEPAWRTQSDLLNF